MQTVIVKQGQSIQDIAIIYTGTIDTCFEIAKLNTISIMDNLIVGQSIIVPDPTSKKGQILFNEKKMPATEIIELSVEVNPLSGINYWAIEETFEVQ
ncbi:LysM peptidoglycan-binding domain-containing protein [Chryseobacterium cucumeris]|uniref:LysM peptidoglycan-binding domain-containing protein n=1 Tax=Chryseobacterium cucumeris TaxID=1813611 RepID=UPI0037BED8B3